MEETDKIELQIADLVKQEQTIKANQYLQKNEVEMFAKADVLGFKYITVGNKGQLANNESECEGDKAKLKAKAQ